jgi:hypothetical protein
MEQFNLEEYKKNPNRKVVTRDGRVAIIICTNADDKFPVVAKIQGLNVPFAELFDRNGICSLHWDNCIFDLFFADEEKTALTDFESAFCIAMMEVPEPEEKEEWYPFLKKKSAELIDLARKEIEEGAVEFAKSYMEDVNPSFEKVQESEELWKWKMSCLRGINKAYEQGKQDALKSSPKWKKDNNNLSSLTYRLDNRGDGNILLCRKGYAINLIELLNLPIEN